VDLRGQRQDDQYRASQFFSVRHGRKRRGHRAHRCVRASGDRCIRRGLRRLDRVRWVWVREQEWLPRDRCVREHVRERRREGLDKDMCRGA
jgi:hypothetical protein